MPDSTKWKNNQKVIKATQVAFELEQKIARDIHVAAAQEGLTPSNQIRKLIGLPYSLPKRPRLTVSLSPDDYDVLGQKYKLDSQDTLEIKRRIMQELIQTLKK